VNSEERRGIGDGIGEALSLDSITPLSGLGKNPRGTMRPNSRVSHPREGKGLKQSREYKKNRRDRQLSAREQRFRFRGRGSAKGFVVRLKGGRKKRGEWGLISLWQKDPVCGPSFWVRFQTDERPIDV